MSYMSTLFTVPTTCSRPSIEMVDFMYVCITVPTTCSRPSIEMVAFMYVCISPCSLSKSDRIRLRGRT